MKKNSQFIKNGDVTLHITICSPDKDETVFLLHGGPGVPDDMPEVVNHLGDKYRVVFFEQRGVGLSECKNCSFTMEDYIADLDTISNYLEIRDFHLFGHSWGGLYAQIYAEARMDKVKSLFLCSPSSGTSTTWKRTEKEVLRFNKNSTSMLGWLKMGWNSMLGMFGDSKAYQKMFEQVLRNYHSRYGNIAINEKLLSGIHAEPINKTRKEVIKYKPLTRLDHPDFPIMITYGDNDIYGESKNELIDRYPTAKVQIIEKSGHIPWKHYLGKFKTILDDFYNIEPNR